MTDRITLTNEERDRLAKAAKHLRDAKRYWEDQPNAAAARAEADRLFSEVVSARVAEAMRDAASSGHGQWLSHSAWQHRLNDLANEYDPKEKA